MSDKQAVQMWGVYTDRGSMLTIGDTEKEAINKAERYEGQFIAWDELLEEGYTCRPVFLSEQEPVDAALPDGNDAEGGGDADY